MNTPESGEVFLDRLDSLACRLEMDGQYVDANIVYIAYVKLANTEPPKWRKQVEEDNQPDHDTV